MQIAVASQNRKTITGHTGRCRRFWIFRIDDDQITDRSLLELSREQSFHETPGSASHPLDGVDVLITGGMGQPLVARLGRRGTEALVTSETDPERAVRAYLAGTLAVELPGEKEGHHHHDDAQE